MQDQSHTTSDSARIPAVTTPRADGARFFECDDNGHVWYSLVAVDLDHAKNLLRRAGCTFGPDETTLDLATGVTWSELSEERLARKLRCHTEDERGVIPLAHARIGERFCSEW